MPVAFPLRCGRRTITATCGQHARRPGFTRL